MKPKRKRRLNVYSLILYSMMFLIVANSVFSIYLANQFNRVVDVAQHAIETSKWDQEIARDSIRELNEYREALEKIKAETKEQPVTERKLWVEATAYCPCPKCCGIWSEQHPSRIGTDYKQLTSSGTKPQAHHTLATDPAVIPTGSKVLIYGEEYVAEDVGGGVNGNHIDIFFDTHEEAVAFGRQYLEVTIIAE